MSSVNAHYLRQTDDEKLAGPHRADAGKDNWRRFERRRSAKIVRGMPGLKTRAKTLVELAEGAVFFMSAPAYSGGCRRAEDFDEGGAAAIAKLLSRWTHSKIGQTGAGSLGRTAAELKAKNWVRWPNPSAPPWWGRPPPPLCSKPWKSLARQSVLAVLRTRGTCQRLTVTGQLPGLR